MAPVEKRIDPEDGVAYTWEEISEFYRGKYKKAEIASFWETLKVAKGKKGKAEPEPKAKAKAKAKADSKKAEPKAKAKSAPKKDLRPAGGFKVCICGGAGGIGQPLSL